LSAVTEQVYIGLGSNLENPALQIKQAVSGLKSIPGCRYLGDSGLYLSKPLIAEDAQIKDQPDYYNAVASLETELTADELLISLQAIEKHQGRVRDEHWGPRTIDLDILLYGQHEISHESLQIPHLEMCKREFVLYPLQRLSPEIHIPGHGMLNQIIKKCPENGMTFVGEIE
jgi:2-amino-4-hydroxy-6-hydroxymethyldihydropteridine diphosphokinase